VKAYQRRVGRRGSDASQGVVGAFALPLETLAVEGVTSRGYCNRRTAAGESSLFAPELVRFAKARVIVGSNPLFRSVGPGQA
jgi:hypothetical protein